MYIPLRTMHGPTVRLKDELHRRPVYYTVLYVHP